MDLFKLEEINDLNLIQIEKENLLNSRMLNEVIIFTCDKNTELLFERYFEIAQVTDKETGKVKLFPYSLKNPAETFDALHERCQEKIKEIKKENLIQKLITFIQENPTTSDTHLYLSFTAATDKDITEARNFIKNTQNPEPTKIITFTHIEEAENKTTTFLNLPIGAYFERCPDINFKGPLVFVKTSDSDCFCLTSSTPWEIKEDAEVRIILKFSSSCHINKRNEK